MKEYDFLEVRRLGFLKRPYLKAFRKLTGCAACDFLDIKTGYCSNLDSYVKEPLNLHSCPEWKRRKTK